MGENERVETARRLLREEIQTRAGQFKPDELQKLAQALSILETLDANLSEEGTESEQGVTVTHARATASNHATAFAEATVTENGYVKRSSHDESGNTSG